MDGSKSNMRKRNPITSRTPFKGLFEAVDLPRAILQISTAMEGDAITLTLQHPGPREMFRRFSYKMNRNVLVGFCITASQVLYLSTHKESMTPEKRAFLIFFIFAYCTMNIFLLETYLAFPRRISQQERRRARLVGWLQETLMVTVLAAMVYWILQDPIVPLMIVPT